MDSFDYCQGRSREKKLCQFAEHCKAEKIEVTVNDDFPDRVFCIGFNEKRNFCMRDDKPIGTLKINANNWELNMNNGLTEQIKKNADKIAEIISRGNHVELLENKDGLRIMEIKRGVVK